VEVTPRTALTPFGKDYGVAGTAGRPELSELAAQLSAQFPDSSLDTSGKAWRLVGPPEAHYWLALQLGRRAAAGRTDPKADRSKTVVTLHQEASIGSVLQTVAKQLELELDYAPELEEVLRERVVVDVERVTYEELIDHVLESAGLAYEITGGRLLIRRR
jgi:hypothetical protein